MEQRAQKKDTKKSTSRADYYADPIPSFKPRWTTVMSGAAQSAPRSALDSSIQAYPQTRV